MSGGCFPRESHVIQSGTVDVFGVKDSCFDFSILRYFLRFDFRKFGLRVRSSSQSHALATNQTPLAHHHAHQERPRQEGQAHRRGEEKAQASEQGKSARIFSGVGRDVFFWFRMLNQSLSLTPPRAFDVVLFPTKNGRRKRIRAKRRRRKPKTTPSAPVGRSRDRRKLSTDKKHIFFRWGKGCL